MATDKLPQNLHAAYDRTASAGELNELASLRGDALEAYAAESEENALANDVRDVTASDIVELSEWLVSAVYGGSQP